MSSDSQGGAIGGISEELLARLRKEAKERGLPEDLEPEAMVLALAASPGEGEFARLVREISKALEGLDRVAEEKGRKL